MADPIVAKIQGTPHADTNGIVALLDAKPASQLFAEFLSVHMIVISLRYSDGTADQLEVRGMRDNRKLGGNEHGYFNQCMGNFRVPSGGETITTVP